MNNPTHAHVTLSRLGGLNKKVVVEYKGKSVYVAGPTEDGVTFRLNAAKFIAGTPQIRDSLCIRPWTDGSERRAKSEENWQS